MRRLLAPFLLVVALAGCSKADLDNDKEKIRELLLNEGPRPGLPGFGPQQAKAEEAPEGAEELPHFVP